MNHFTDFRLMIRNIKINNWSKGFSAIIIILVVGIVHRLCLFNRYLPKLNHLIKIHPQWYDWHNLPMPLLKDRFADAMIYLQQSPPISNIVFSIALKNFEWPYQTSYFFLGFITILSIISTVLMFIVMNRISGKPKISLILSLIFLLSADLVILEYNSFGQAFYDHLSMALLLILVNLFITLRETKNSAYAIAIGVVVAILALTRSTYSYLFLSCMPFMLFARPKFKSIVLFLTPVLLLHAAGV